MKEYRLTKIACYFMGVSTSVVSILSALLFVTFRDIYSISYTKLGFLVVINFCTQLIIDLFLSFFSHRCNVKMLIKAMPILAFVGFIIYAVFPPIFPEDAYLYIALGTVIFSAASGLCEVLTSPIIAAIPSPNSEKAMLRFHSAYAWGLVGVIITGTFMLYLFGRENWFYLPLIFSILPFLTSLMFMGAKIPDLNFSSSDKKKNSPSGIGFFMCILLIFLAGCAECTMTQWMSGFSEKALGIPKAIGDIFGIALFSLFMAIMRITHKSKDGNLYRVFIVGFSGAFIAYVVASLSMNPIISLISCIVTGLFVAVLWPESLVLMSTHYSSAGVGAYALMAAGGDLGASVAPQLVGILADKVGESNFAHNLSEHIGISTEEIGMRAGLLSGALFTLVGVILILLMKRYFKKKSEKIK